MDNSLVPVEKNEDVCLLDSETIHTIINGKFFFSNLTLHKANVQTISSSIEIIDCSGKATIILSNGTTLYFEDTLLSNRSKKNLLSFKDVRRNGYHLEIINENNNNCLCFTSYKMGRTIHWKLDTLISRLYCAPIRVIESYTTMS